MEWSILPTPPKSIKISNENFSRQTFTSAAKLTLEVYIIKFVWFCSYKLKSLQTKLELEDQLSSIVLSLSLYHFLQENFELYNFII